MYKEKSLKIKTSPSDLIIEIICKIICLICFLFFAVPIGYVLISSVYSMGTWSLEGYMLLLKNEQILLGLKNSVLLTVIGTFYSLLLEIPVAYVTSKKEFGWLANFFYYISLFGIALLPLYLLLKKLNLLNNLWGLILPRGISVYYMQQLRARMLIQADELEDAASLDGCGPVRFLLQICIPVMAPTVGVISFFHACGYWGSTLLAKTILTDESKFPLTLVLNQVMIQNQTASILGRTEAIMEITTLHMAEFGICVISALPMVALFMLMKRHIKTSENRGGLVM